MAEREAESAPVAVIGGGFAGVAAAFAATRGGARVVLLHAAPGASELWSGIVDAANGVERPARRADAANDATPGLELAELTAAFGLVLSERPRAVATREGGVRDALGRERALLDLEALAGRVVGVADVGRDDWDATLLAKSFAASAWARATKTEFRSVRVAALVGGVERRIAPYDLARRWDEPARTAALAKALSAAPEAVDAWLFGPWLGVESDVAASLRATLGRPVGETASLPGGAAGARFEIRRRALLASLGVEVRRARASAVRAAAEGLEIELERGERLAARAVVLALGGVASGGIVLAGSSESGLPFRASVEAPVEPSLEGEVLDRASAVPPVAFQRVGLAALERIGLSVDEALCAASGLAIYACGDLVAGRERTVLEALRSGVLAGGNAAESGP